MDLLNILIKYKKDFKKGKDYKKKMKITENFVKDFISYFEKKDK